MAKEFVKDFYGRIIGSTEVSGDKVIVRDFYNRILGWYDKRDNTTRDFYGKIISKGDTAIGLIYRNKQ